MTDAKRDLAVALDRVRSSAAERCLARAVRTVSLSTQLGQRWIPPPDHAPLGRDSEGVQRSAATPQARAGFPAV